MTRFDLSTSASELRDALEDLQLAWQLTTETWSDEVSRNFARDHLEPIGPAVKKALDGIDHIWHQMEQMRWDCEE